MYTIYADGQLLYSPTEAEEGYAVFDPKLTMELNKAGSLEFTMPPSNVMYDQLQKLKTYVTVEQDGTEIWRGRVLHDEKDFYLRKHIYCEGQLAFLMDAVMRPYDYHGGVGSFLGRLLSAYNEQVDESKQLHQGTCTVTDPNDYIYRANSDYSDVLTEINEKLINSLGGYLLIKKASTYRYLEYRETAGSISDQVIMFGSNLLDISEYIDASNVFTVLIPLGAKQENQDGSEGARLTIASVNNGKDYIENATGISLFGKIWRSAYWDDVTVASNLLTKGRAYLENGISMAVTLSIKAVDLHLLDVNTAKIFIGNYYRVVSEPHGLDTLFLCSKAELDLVNPDKTSYTFGVTFDALTDKQIAAMKRSQNAFTLAESASSAANVASTNVVNVVGDYVKKTEFLQFETQVNSNFTNVNAALTAVCHYCGSVSTLADLPASGNKKGDTYNVTGTGANYTWTGTAWDKLSEDIDLSPLALRTEIPTKVSDLQNDSGFLTEHQSLSGYVTQSDFNALADRVTLLEGNNT